MPVNTTPLRVMLLCDWFLKYTASFALGLAHAGNDVCLVCRGHAHEFGHTQHERTRTLEHARAGGVEIIEFPERMSSRQRAAVRAAREARRWRPQIAHVQSATFEPRLFFALGRRQPLVMTIHDPVPHEGHRLRRRNLLIERAWRRRADCLVVHSEQLVPALGSVPQRIAVLPHGADILATPLPRPRTPSVLLFGRLEPYKGVRVLSDAMQDVWEKRPDVRLLVCGEGPAKNDLPDDPRVEAIKASWRGVRPLAHISVSRENIVVGHCRETLPDFAALSEAGHKAAHLRGHSDGMWNSAVNALVARHLEWCDVEVEAKSKNIASRQLADFVRALEPA